MRHSHLSLGLIVGLLMVGCTHKNDELSQYRPEINAPHTVEIVPEEETLMLSDLMDGYELIEPKGMLLSSISGVFPYDSTYILVGKSIEDYYVHQFDRNGNYMRSMLHTGQGPDEATSLFSTKLYGDDLYFLTDAGIKLMRYSLKEGKMVESFTLPEEINGIGDFAVLGNGKYLIYKEHPQIQGEEYKLYLYNRPENKIEQRWIPMLKQAWEDYLWFGQSNCLYQFGDKHYFYEIFQRGIYEVDENGPKGYISFKVNSYTMPDEGVYNSYPDLTQFLEYCQPSSYIWAHRSMYEGTRFILSSFLYHNLVHWNVIDKKQWTSHSYPRVKDDLLLESEMLVTEYPYEESVKDNIHYFKLPYTTLQKILEQKKEAGELEEYAHRHPDMMELYEHMNEDSNDIIVRFHEKQ